MAKGAVVCISHGGGPMPLLGDEGHKGIVQSLTARVPRLLKLGTPEAPRAIVVVTAHWSQGQPAISSGPRHSLYYDYGGFPREAYSLKYDAPGSPPVAEEVRRALEGAGFRPEMDSKRGWDHGVFVPMLLINPAADVPIVQLSVLRSQDPDDHIRMGRALAPLRDSNVAILGSGFASWHNLASMRPLMMGALSPRDLLSKTGPWNRAVTDAATAEGAEERGERLAAWRQFPSSYDMHPRGGAEHFMPLLVCAGAGGDGRAGCYKDDFYGVDIWSYYWNE